MSSVERTALIGSPRKDTNLFPRYEIFSLERVRSGLLVLPVWPQMEMAVHFETFAFRWDQSSHHSVVQSIV